MYNEKEIKNILRRAHELQNRSEGSAFSHRNEQQLTLEEIEEIARESGVSAEYVRQAAVEFEGVPVEEPLFLDTGNTYEVELIGFAKGEIDKKTWAELRAVIEYHFDSPGKVKRRPDGLVWKAQPKGILKFLHTRTSPEVEVSSSSNKTTFRVSQSLKTFQKLMYPAYAALAGAAGFTAIAMLEAPEVLFVTAGLLATAKLFHSWASSKKNKAREKLKDAVEQFQTIVTRRHTAFQKNRLMDNESGITLQELNEEVTEQEQAGNTARQKTKG